MRIRQGLLAMGFLACEGTTEPSFSEGPEVPGAEAEDYGYVSAEEVSLRQAPTVDVTPGVPQFDAPSGDGLNGSLPPRLEEVGNTEQVAPPKAEKGVDLAITDEQRAILEATSVHSTAVGGAP